MPQTFVGGGGGGGVKSRGFDFRVTNQTNTWECLIES